MEINNVKFENFFALLKQIVDKIIKMVLQTKAWIDANFEEPTSKEETTGNVA